MGIKHVGDGKVVLLSGGDRVFTDVAARFVGSERSLDDITGSSYDKKLVKNIISSGHLAATEFDYFIFGIEGYSRVTETQLVRKRLASYLIKSGRKDKGGKRSFDVVLPEEIEGNKTTLMIPRNKAFIQEDNGEFTTLEDSLGMGEDFRMVMYTHDILGLIESWYNEGVSLGYKEEDLRYLKPQATEFKAIIGMNAHALLDWFSIRCCLNAQTETRDLATSMLRLCKESSPDLFTNAGASCVRLGYCPENRLQNESCRGNIPTHETVLEYIEAIRVSTRRGTGM